MITFLVNARPADLRDLAGVDWEPRARDGALVRWGTWQRVKIGIEKARRRLHAVHVPDEATRDALVSFLAGCVVFGAAPWGKKADKGIPRISGMPVPERLGAAEGRRVNADGSVVDLSDDAADAELSAIYDGPDA